jgi:beta-lactamase regulating signal transducer with metallopeptidase domain
MSNADLLQFWFSWIASATLQMAFFVPLVAIAARALRGFPARFRYALWFLVIFKAFIPPGVVLPWTVSGAGLNSASTGAIKVVALFADPIVGHHGVGRAGLDIGLSEPVWTEPVLRGMVDYLGYTGAMVLLAAWLVGMCIFWIMTFMQQWETTRLVAASRRVTDGPIHDELVRLARSIGLSRIPKLVLSSEVSGPFLCGLFRPAIVLPAELPGLVSASDLRAVFAARTYALSARRLARVLDASRRAVHLLVPSASLVGERPHRRRT